MSGKIITLENAKAQKQAEQRKALAVDLSSQIAIRCDKYEADIAFPALCAVFAQQIKKRIHSTNFMNAIGQMAQEIHRMVFDPETQAKAQEVSQEVRAELDELTKNANRWIIFCQLFDDGVEEDDGFGEFFIQCESSEQIKKLVDEKILEAEKAAERVAKASEKSE